MNFQTTGYTIKQVQQQIHTIMEDALRPVSLNLSQYNVLKNLDASASLTGADLARKAFVTPQTMHTMLTTMERKALISREPVPGNKKSFNVSIAPDGKKALAGAEQALQKLFDSANRALTEQEHAILDILLMKLSRELDESKL